MDLLCGKEHDRPRPGGQHPDGARWLGILNETGFFGRYLPDWARIVGQMQFDTYHIFTVDEHTIEAVRVLNTLERGNSPRSRRSPRSWWTTSSRGARSIWRCCCTTSPKVAAAITRRSGAEVALEVRPGSGPDRRGNRDSFLAGAPSLAAERDGIQARHR